LTEIRMLESKLQLAIKDVEFSRDVAERSSRAKSEFLSRMSHEMLTPMNAVLGMTQIAKMAGSLEKIMTYISEIDTASKHLVRMIHNVLNVSDRSGAFSLTESQFTINGMLEYILGRINPELFKKSQILTHVISPSLPERFIGDEKRITQVIIHLLANAVKFSPEQSEIILSAHVHDEGDDMMMLRFEVADTGIGISEEQQANLFELFEQADGGHNRRYGGIGIGLPLSKCIVELLDGEIWVKSELGKGSVFSFTCMVKKDN